MENTWISSKTHGKPVEKRFDSCLIDPNRPKKTAALLLEVELLMGKSPEHPRLCCDFTTTLVKSRSSLQLGPPNEYVHLVTFSNFT